MLLVGYLHRQGWLHLDLKPTNVIVDCGIVRLFDLSLVRRPGPGKGRYGTAGWLSPEQERGDAFGAATDAFGVAGVLFAAATRRAPCPWQRAGEGGGATAPPRVRSLRRLPGPLAEAIDAGLAGDPRPGRACATSGPRVRPSRRRRTRTGVTRAGGAVDECRPELPCSGPHP